jgi:hypothetical protein
MRHRTTLSAAAFFVCVCLSAARAEAMSFNVTFDSSVSGAPSGFLTAFNFEVQFLQSQFLDPITINVNVGWGEVAGHALAPGNLGQSQTNQQQYTYAQVHGAMQADAKSPDDATAVGSLPASNSSTFAMSNAEAKALGLLAGNATGTDGFVGFNSSASYTFDPNSRAVPGEWDFLGIAAHELTEVMGRYGWGQNGSGSRQSPIDLFRFSAPGVRNLQPTFGGPLDFFSINGGVTNINTFNTTCVGADLADWIGPPSDSFNTCSGLATGTLEPFSAGDVRLMDVLGYDVAATTPEPQTLVLIGSGLVALACQARGRLRTRS